jgi:hypothetical protein
VGLLDVLKKSSSKKAAKASGKKGGDSLQDPIGGGLGDSLEPQWTQNPLYGSKEASSAVGGGLGGSQAITETVAEAPKKKGFFGKIKEKLSKTFSKKNNKPKTIDTMKDKHVDSWTDGASDVAASAHEVKRVTYKNNIGDTDTKEGFFKPYSNAFHGSPEGEEAGIGKYDAMNGDAVLAESNLIARSLASTRFDQKLGLDIIAHETQAKHGGRKGVVSAKTKGKALADQPEIDLKNPETQKGLNRLQAFDYLSGQVDRHGGNVYVDPESGKVTGIDNDLAWGADNAPVEKGGGRNSFGLPAQIDKEMAEKLTGMSEEEFLSVLKARKGDYQELGDEETAAAKQRFAKMKTWISGGDESTPGAKIVDAYDDTTYGDTESAIKRTDKNGKALDYGFASVRQENLGGYLQRAIVTQEAAKKQAK